MIGGTPDLTARDEIAASWDRCERQYKLARGAVRPIMRLQSSEIAPRLERIVERTGGRQGFFRQLAAVAGDGKRCLVVTDADGVLVRLEAAGDGRAVEDWNGIALGSCWGERIAGTNGVSMALRSQKPFTVSGADHFYEKLKAFACTGAPIFDAEGALVGSVNLVTFDHGNRADHHFAREFLDTAAQRIQRRLFEQQFADAMLVSISPVDRAPLLSGDGLIAVDEAGIILGATSPVDRMFAEGAPRGLKGQPFEAVFDIESRDLAKIPERVLSMPMTKGPAVKISARLPGRARPVRPAAAVPEVARRRGRLPPSLRQLATGSKSMAAVCAEAEVIYRAGRPFLIEGETGTGKSALVAALAGDTPLLKVDCAAMRDTEADLEALRAVMSQARVLALMSGAEAAFATVVLDNIDEIPAQAQSELRRMLDDLETEQLSGGNDRGVPRIVALCKQPLDPQVSEGRFRDDLYYRVAGTRVFLPPLREREQPEVLAQVLASRIANRRTELSEEAVELIRQHPFPGNVRELAAALERALLTAKHDRITPVDLRTTSIAMGVATAAIRPAAAAPRLAYDERTMIQDALQSSGWNVSEAARRLGMGRATINRKIKYHGLARPV